GDRPCRRRPDPLGAIAAGGADRHRQAVPPGMTAELIDRAMLADMVEHLGVAALRPVIDLFTEESRRYAATIRDGDREQARRAAHSLKSSAGQLGAAALSAAAAETERRAAGGSGRDARPPDRRDRGGDGGAVRRMRRGAPFPTPPCGGRSSTG